ncbi:MAG: TrpR family protein YerC/YecD [Candidatus Moranbacteria bacterium GW2011_GWE2_35_2-]|nr:MAG: TrpR family protein YerC/YecD [Candidatus Moranbacteria bacterium GW2011_GWE2_35_2-]KKQ52556.1 MAG: TrpR family protein YerC/YecD [Parcubacteria group bacterium GW2011_GWD2_38_11]
MSKVKPHTIDPKEKFQAIDSLFDVILKLKTKQEIVDFFLGLFTSSESLMMARRIQIARMLLDNKSYDEIKNKLKVASQTIHATDKWLHKGDEKYTTWLKTRVSEIENKNKRKNNLTYESLLDKYSHHRFIKNLFE